MTCASCRNWQLKASKLARHGLAACALLPRWTHYPETHSCAQHKPTDPQITAKRMAWLNPKGK